MLFGEGYPYYSSVSPELTAHFAASASALLAAQGYGPGSRVLEIACNDGCLLRHFRAAGCETLGIDPAAGPAAAARAGGLAVRESFFHAGMADELGRWDLVLANNVLAHVPDTADFVRGIAALLEPDGLAVIEVPYLGDLLAAGAFDTIYHQHLCYFSVTALEALFASAGLVLAEIERLAIHGGSLRLFVRPAGAARGRNVQALLDAEATSGLATTAPFGAFARRIERIAAAIRERLEAARGRGATLAGYGAAAKATTLLSVCGVGAYDLAWIADLNPRKHGRYMPGCRIPIVGPDRLIAERPDLVLLLAWNFATEIADQQREYLEAGGAFLVPVPEPRLLRHG
jgi:SAM-dependent methyltransferase